MTHLLIRGAYVRMYFCIHVLCIYVCVMYICTYVCVNVYMYVCIYVRRSVNVRMYYVCMCIYMYVCMYVCMCVYVCMYVCNLRRKINSHCVSNVDRYGCRSMLYI